MSRDSIWNNKDGLSVGFGRREDDNTAAVASRRGSLETLRQVVTLADLEDTDSVTSASFELGNAASIPRGSYITAARVIPTVTAVGATATLDIGTYDKEYLTAAGADDITVDDADGIDVDIAVAALAVGTITAANGALVGGTVSVGATSNSDVVVIAAYQTAAFTAGEIIIEVDYVRPAGSANLTNDYQVAV